MGLNYKSAQEILPILKRCAVDAGIYHAWFLAYGTTLGSCREYQHSVGKLLPIPHDDDLDVGIQSWLVTKEQEDKYFDNLKAAGMFKHRERHAYRPDNNRHLWFSLRKTKDGCKCCNWFMFKWNNFVWHCKGKLWVTEDKFDKRKWRFTGNEEAICKGVPAYLLDKLIEIEYRGETYHVPFLAGSCCDEWYPGWNVPRKGGASKKHYVLLIPKFAEPNRWRII